MVKRHRKKFVENIQARGKYQEKPNRRAIVDKNTVAHLPIRGLHNLGNTCYLNSVIQCLSRSPHLFQLLGLPLCSKATLKRPDGSGVATLNIELVPKDLPAAAQLTDLALRVCHKPHESGTTAISPSALRELVILKHARFSGFGQHDCHEFLRALLDCLRQEELLVWRKGILDKFSFNENCPEEQRQLIRAWGRAASFATRVDRLFGGIIVSSLKCDSCHDVRTNFEFFLDLSLPIPESKIGVGQVPDSDGPKRNSGKSKQELKRERRKKPQKMRRKHERARMLSELELADDNSSGLAGNDDPVDTPLKSDPSAYDANSGPPSVHRRDNTLSGTEFDHNPTVTVRSASASAEDDTHELDGDLPTTGECTNVIGCDGDTDDGVLVDVVDTLDKLTADKAVVNTEMTENTSGPATNLYDSQKISQDSVITQQSYSSSDGDCADFEDSDGTERRNAVSQPLSNSLDGDLLTNNLIPSTDAHDTTTVPEFLVEQLRQLDLDESKAANTECLLNRASRLAQIPLQASTLIPCGAARPLGDIACDLYSCLSLFTAPEHLIGANRIVCPRCNKQADAESDPSKVSDADNTKSRDLPRLTEAIRRDLVLQPPALLTIHLKRFQQIGVHIQKSQKRVSFPILLDLSPFCSVLYVSSSRSVRYRLYGVVEHLGRMAGGHYVAYVAAHAKSNAEMESDSSAQKSGNNSSDTSEFVKRFVGQLDTAPKWPMTTHDLLQRWRRCDRVRLSESVEETKSMVDDMLNRSNRAINGNPTADNSSPAHSQPSPQTSVPGHKEEEAVVDTRTWFRCSDEHVDTVPLSTVLECQAYVLFYERIE